MHKLRFLLVTTQNKVFKGGNDALPGQLRLLAASLPFSFTPSHFILYSVCPCPVLSWSSASPRGQWRTAKNGENWLQNHL